MIYHQSLARDIEDNTDMLSITMYHFYSFLHNKHNILADVAAAFLNIQSSNEESRKKVKVDYGSLRYSIMNT